MLKENTLDMLLVKYLLIVSISLFDSIAGQVNTEAMRSEDDRFGFSNQFSLDVGYEKASSEVLDLASEYRLDYINQNNLHSFMIISLENGYEKEENTPKNIITNKGFVHLRTTKKLTPKYQVEIFTQYEFNEFLLLNDRYLLGSGLRIGFNNNKLSKDKSVSKNLEKTTDEGKHTTFGGLGNPSSSTKYIHLHCVFKRFATRFAILGRVARKMLENTIKKSVS